MKATDFATKPGPVFGKCGSRRCNTHVETEVRTRTAIEAAGNCGGMKGGKGGKGGKRGGY